MNITIRKSTYADLTRINKIYNQAVQGGATGNIFAVSKKKREDWYNKEDRKRYPVFVVETEKKIVGWLSFSSYRTGRKAFKNTSEISYYVDNAFQRKGIGDALIKFAIAQACQSGFKTLLAIILDHNKGSIKLLEKHGFTQWGFLPDVGEIKGELRGHCYYGLSL